MAAIRLRGYRPLQPASEFGPRCPSSTPRPLHSLFIRASPADDTSRTFSSGIQGALLCQWNPAVLSLHRKPRQVSDQGRIFESKRDVARHFSSHAGGKSVAAAAAQSARTDSDSSSRIGTGKFWENGISFNCAVGQGETDTQRRWAHSIGADLSVNASTSELASLQYDSGILILVMVGAFIWVRLFDFFTSHQILEQKLSRKMMHITSGLLFMLSWPLFSSSKWAPFIAGAVPLANGLRLLIYGLGLRKNEGIVNSMSRSGDPRELLRGPFYYVLVLFASTVLFWRQSPVGMVALAMMCGGDGIADIMGRKFGSEKLPYNREKSFAGSVSMFLFGFLVSSLFVYYFTALGFFKLDPYTTAGRLALISLVSTVVESLPMTTRLDDNFTVPACAFALGVLLFPSN